MSPRTVTKTKNLTKTITLIAVGVGVIGAGIAMAIFYFYRAPKSLDQLYYENLNACLCGNGKTERPYEQCDDGNRVAGDGCGVNCTVETKVLFDGKKINSCDSFSMRNAAGWSVLKIGSRSHKIAYTASSPEDGSEAKGVLLLDSEDRREPIFEGRVITIDNTKFTLTHGTETLVGRIGDEDNQWYSSDLVIRLGDNRRCEYKACNAPKTTVTIKSNGFLADGGPHLAKELLIAGTLGAKFATFYPENSNSSKVVKVNQLQLNVFGNAKLFKNTKICYPTENQKGTCQFFDIPSCNTDNSLLKSCAVGINLSSPLVIEKRGYNGVPVLTIAGDIVDDAKASKDTNKFKFELLTKDQTPEGGSKLELAIQDINSPKGETVFVTKNWGEAEGPIVAVMDNTFKYPSITLNQLPATVVGGNTKTKVASLSISNLFYPEGGFPYTDIERLVINLRNQSASNKKCFGDSINWSVVVPESGGTKPDGSRGEPFNHSFTTTLKNNAINLIPNEPLVLFGYNARNYTVDVFVDTTCINDPARYNSKSDKIAFDFYLDNSYDSSFVDNLWIRFLFDALSDWMDKDIASGAQQSSPPDSGINNQTNIYHWGRFGMAKKSYNTDGNLRRVVEVVKETTPTPPDKFSIKCPAGYELISSSNGNNATSNTVKMCRNENFRIDVYLLPKGSSAPTDMFKNYPDAHEFSRNGFKGQLVWSDEKKEQLKLFATYNVPSTGASASASEYYIAEAVINQDKLISAGSGDWFDGLAEATELIRQVISSFSIIK